MCNPQELYKNTEKSQNEDLSAAGLPGERQDGESGTNTPLLIKGQRKSIIVRDLFLNRSAGLHASYK